MVMMREFFLLALVEDRLLVGTCGGGKVATATADTSSNWENNVFFRKS
jgi:hypothetical protein